MFNRQELITGVFAFAGGLALPECKRAYSFAQVLRKPQTWAPENIFGDGSDGDLYMPGPIMLTRDLNLQNVVVLPGAEFGIMLNGHTMRIRGVLDVSGARNLRQGYVLEKKQ